MFAIRSAIVCLAFFGAMYCALSCAVAFGWWTLRHLRRMEGTDSAGLLFALRILPLVVSALVSIFLTLPSFWLMERRSFDEDGMTFVLAGFTCLLVMAGAGRVQRAESRTGQVVAGWLSNLGPDNGGATAAMSAEKGAPALMLVGLCRPKVMISAMAAAVLSENELRVAIRHELGHRRSWDNLKKLLINATPFPGLHGIERAWRRAAELAADDSAVQTRRDALDLASALIKLSRSAHQWSEPELASGLLCASSAISVRVQRLLDWNNHPRVPNLWAWTLPSIAILGLVAGNYGTALMLTHRLTEFFVP
jgi:hypothetical protein